MCVDDCNESGAGTIGQCDDGSDQNGLDLTIVDRTKVTCKLGTDCSDCGIRYYCQSCPPECAAQAILAADPLRSCFEHMYDSPMCWEQCNTAECGHKSCTTESSVEVCLKEEERLQKEYKTSPAQVPDAKMTPGDSTKFFGQMSISTDMERGSGVVVSFNLDYKLVWNDTRLAASPCRLVLDSMLSSKGATETEHMELYWRPKLKIFSPYEPPREDALIGSTFSHVFDTALGTSTSTLAIKRSIFQPFEFDYTFFPFDHHILELDIQIPGVSMQGCEAVIASMRETETLPTSERGIQKILPSSGTWLFENCGTVGGGCSPEAIEKDIYLEPDDEIHYGYNGTVVSDTCPVRIAIRRSNEIFVIKQLLPIMVIAEAPLLALWLNPNIPGLVGARCSISIFSMVLVLIKANQDLGLGKLQTIIWTDEFALVQFGIILSALFETIFVHASMRSGYPLLANSVDSVFRKLLPFAVYPFVVLGWYLKGNKQYVAAYSVMASGIGGFLLLGIFASVKKIRDTNKRRAKAVAALVNLDVYNDDEEYSTAVMQEAFEVFDLDGSKKLERKEVRLILSKMYPSMTRKQQLAAMKEIRDEEIPFEGFADAIESWHNIAIKPPEKEKKPPSIIDRLRGKKSDTQAGANWQKMQKAAVITSCWGAAATGTQQKQKLVGAATKLKPGAAKPKGPSKAGWGAASMVKPQKQDTPADYNPDNDDDCF